MVSLTCSLSERTIKAHLRKIIFGSRTRCLRCNNTHLKWNERESRYWCNQCRRHFSLISDTWLRGMKISLKELWVILTCWLSELPVKQVSELSSLSQKAIRRWYRLFREHTPEIINHFSGEVEIDETYFGVRHKGRKGTHWKLNKIPVIGIYSRNSGLIETRELKEATLDYIIPFIKDRLNPKQVHIFSDKYRPYWPLPSLGYRHTMVDHYAHQYKETNRIEGCFSVFKRKLRRIYWSVSKRYFRLYLCEITYRFNTRNNPDTPLEYLQKSLPSAPNGLH